MTQLSSDNMATARHRTILASYSINAEHATEWLRRILNTLAETAALSLENNGAKVVFVDASRTTEDPAELIKTADGVVILGGSDIDPINYGESARSEALYGVDSPADNFELELTRATLRAGIPFLGICRGMQVLNVALGGTLLQDLGPETMHRVKSEDSPMTDHSVRILPGTLLEGIYNADALQIRSGHHQAIAKLGDGLTIAADATDGTVEAIEGSGSWILGVQWHPEDPAADTNQLQTLTAAFVQMCA